MRCSDAIKHASGLTLRCDSPPGHDGDHGGDGYQWDDNDFVWHMDGGDFTRSYGWVRADA